MEKFLDLLERSVIVQAVITVIVVGGTVYLWIAQLPVPNELADVFMLIVGVFFGGKLQAGQSALASKLKK